MRIFGKNWCRFRLMQECCDGVLSLDCDERCEIATFSDNIKRSPAAGTRTAPLQSQLLRTDPHILHKEASHCFLKALARLLWAVLDHRVNRVVLHLQWQWKHRVCVWPSFPAAQSTVENTVVNPCLERIPPLQITSHILVICNITACLYSGSPRLC